MDGLRFPVSIHLTGTLAANATGSFVLPIAMTLESVSAGASNDSDATLMLGSAADSDGIMTAKVIGDSNAPKTFGKTDFNGALCDASSPPHFAKGTIFMWTLDFDGAAGTAAQHVSILFSFLEG